MWSVSWCHVSLIQFYFYFVSFANTVMFKSCELLKLNHPSDGETVAEHKWPSRSAVGGRCETFNGQTLRGMKCMPSFSYSKALCLSSLLLMDFWTSTLGLLFLPTTCLTIKLSARLYDKGHNGFTHSQCTSLQSKVRGTLYKKDFQTFFFLFWNFPTLQRWNCSLRKNFFFILKSFHFTLYA